MTLEFLCASWPVLLDFNSPVLPAALPYVGAGFLGLSLALGITLFAREIRGGERSITRLAGGTAVLGILGFLLIERGPNSVNASAGPPPGTVPLYRLYFASPPMHYYTTDRAERDHLIAMGWDYKEIEGYLYPTPWRFAPGDAPKTTKVEPIEPQPLRPPRGDKPANITGSIVGAWSWPGGSTMWAWSDGRVTWYKGGSEIGNGEWTQTKPGNWLVKSGPGAERCAIIGTDDMVCYNQLNQRFEAKRAQ